MRDSEIVCIFVMVISALWFGIFLMTLDRLKDLMLIKGNIAPGGIQALAPLFSTKIPAMVLWDMSLIGLIATFLVSLLSLFYFMKQKIE